MTPAQRDALAKHLKAAIATIDEIQTSDVERSETESRRLDDLQDKLIAASDALALYGVDNVDAWLVQKLQ